MCPLPGFSISFILTSQVPSCSSCWPLRPGVVGRPLPPPWGVWNWILRPLFGVNSTVLDCELVGWGLGEYTSLKWLVGGNWAMWGVDIPIPDISSLSPSAVLFFFFFSQRKMNTLRSLTSKFVHTFYCVSSTMKTKQRKIRILVHWQSLILCHWLSRITSQKKNPDNRQRICLPCWINVAGYIVTDFIS